MKIKRSTICTLKFANIGKLELLRTILQEYGKVVNFFISKFWENTPKKTKLLKDIVNEPNSWLTHRAKKVAAREAIDLINSTKVSAEALSKQPTMPQHRGRRMHVSSTLASLKHSKNTFDTWLHLASIGNNISLDIPLKGHKHMNRLKSLGKRLESYIITENSVQFCYEIETGPKKDDGKILGVDAGINALATTDEGNQYGTKIKQHIERVKRCNHGSKGQRTAQRALKQYIDETVKEVVSGAKLVVVEALRKLNHKTKLTRRVSKNIRRSLGAWNYRYFLSRVQMACESGCSRFASVSSAYTSQRCHACGHTERANRHGEIFKCRSCEHTDNADVNAAKNILWRFVSGPYGAAYKPLNLSLPSFT